MYSNSLIILKQFLCGFLWLSYVKIFFQRFFLFYLFFFKVLQPSYNNNYYSLRSSRNSEKSYVNSICAVFKVKMQYMRINIAKNNFKHVIQFDSTFTMIYKVQRGFGIKKFKIIKLRSKFQRLYFHIFYVFKGVYIL